MGVVARVLVVSSPLKARGSQLEGRERAGARSEATSDDNGLLSIPRGIVCHDLGMGGDILWGELGQLIWLCVHPTKWLHILQHHKQVKRPLKPK